MYQIFLHYYLNEFLKSEDQHAYEILKILIEKINWDNLECLQESKIVVISKDISKLLNYRLVETEKYFSLYAVFKLYSDLAFR